MVKIFIVLAEVCGQTMYTAVDLYMINFNIYGWAGGWGWIMINYHVSDGKLCGEDIHCFSRGVWTNSPCTQLLICTWSILTSYQCSKMEALNDDPPIPSGLFHPHHCSSCVLLLHYSSVPDVGKLRVVLHVWFLCIFAYSYLITLAGNPFFMENSGNFFLFFSWKI